MSWFLVGEGFASLVGASPKTLIRPGKHSSDMAALVLF